MTAAWDTPAPPPPPGWTVKLPIQLLLFAILAQVLAAQALAPDGGTLSFSSGWRLAIPISVSYALLLGFMSAMARVRFGMPLRRLPGFGALVGRARWVGVAVGVALYGFNLGFASLVDLGIENTELFRAVRGHADLLTLALPVVVLAPLFEELLFRGFFYGAFERHGRVVAIGLSASIFAGMHFLTYARAPLAVIPVFAVGLANGWLRARTAAMDACVASHATFNLLGLASWAIQLAAQEA